MTNQDEILTVRFAVKQNYASTGTANDVMNSFIDMDNVDSHGHVVDCFFGKEPPSRETKRAMGWIVTELCSMALGNRSEHGTKKYDRMSNPKPGDLVWEGSTIYHLLYRDPELLDDRWDGQFVPYLRTVTEVWYTEKDEDGEDREYFEEVHYCQNPDGTEFRWTNATLYAVPNGPKWGE